MDIKKIFRVNNKDNTNDNNKLNDYGTPFNLGNSYNINKNLEAQININKNSINDIETNFSSTVNSKISDVLKKLTDEYIDKNINNDYFLLNYQADYFCNTIRFFTKNNKLAFCLKRVIRAAFLFGRSGLMINNGKYKPIQIVKAELDAEYNLKNVYYVPLSISLLNMGYGINEYDDKVVLKYNEKMDGKLFIFNWDTNSTGAFVKMYPFIKFQQMMLKMLIANTIVFGKKFIYTINSLNTLGNELECLMDPLKPFIVRFKDSEALSNVYDDFNFDGKNALDFIYYYKQAIASFYELYGRKINSNFKKERNISSEVQIEEEQYEIIQNEWISNFKLFINEINNNIDEESKVIIYD